MTTKKTPTNQSSDKSKHEVVVGPIRLGMSANNIQKHISALRPSDVKGVVGTQSVGDIAGDACLLEKFTYPVCETETTNLKLDVNNKSHMEFKAWCDKKGIQPSIANGQRFDFSKRAKAHRKIGGILVDEGFAGFYGREQED